MAASPAETPVVAPGDGKVPRTIGWIIPAAADSEDGGVTVEAGTVVAKLAGFEKLEKKVAEVEQRLGYYQDRFDRSQAANDKAAMAANEAKLEQKRAALEEANAALAPFLVKAPVAGTFKASMKVGDPVAPDIAVGTVTGPPQLAAAFALDAPGSWAVGDEVVLKVESDSAQQVTCSVATVSDTEVTATCPDALAAGTVVVLE